jgi:hypothetical protein
MPRPRSGVFYMYRACLPLTFVGIALLSTKKSHGFFVFLQAIGDGNNPPRTNGLTDTHTLGNYLEVALRRIPIAPDPYPNFEVRRRTSPTI